MAEKLAAINRTCKRIADGPGQAGENKGLKLSASITNFDRQCLKFLWTYRRAHFGSGGRKEWRCRCDFDLFRLVADLQREIYGHYLCNRDDNLVGQVRLEALFLRFQAIRARRNGDAVIAGAAGRSGPLHAGFDVSDGQRQIGNYASAGILCGTCNGTEVSLRKGIRSYGRKEA